MQTEHRKVLRAIVLELRHLLEGFRDSEGRWHPGDLELRMAGLGVRRDREPVPVDELPHLPDEDRRARSVVDAYLALRRGAGASIADAVGEFVRETAYTWTNRLLALRCMEARELIDEAVLQKETYGGRSLEHYRLAKRQPELCTGDDDGLFAMLAGVFQARATSLPLLFDPHAPGVALRPSPAVLKRCIALLSGTESVRGQPAATGEVFAAPDALGWAYQYWNTEEKDRVFETVRTKKGAKIQGADIIPATQLYTEPYMVDFLVQNSLGATWIGMRPDTRLVENWPYFVRDADRAPVEKKPVAKITFLDPACGSGHFLIVAFDIFFGMYQEEGMITDPEAICRSILACNLHGIDIDERAVQIAEAALWMKAAERCSGFEGCPTNLVATNIRLPHGQEQLKAFLRKYPEDTPLRSALEVVFEGLEHVDEFGSLLHIELPVEKELRHLREQELAREQKGRGELFESVRTEEDWAAWRTGVMTRLRAHFVDEARSADAAEAFFGRAAAQSLNLLDGLARRYDVVAANPPYARNRKLGTTLNEFLKAAYPESSRDLYSAFIERCTSLLSTSGHAALVTLHSWMFLNGFRRLRQRLLAERTIETLAYLGPGAFSEISGEVVITVMVLLGAGRPTEAHRIPCFDLRGHDTKGKAEALVGRSPGALPLQATLASLPDGILAYWIQPWAERAFLELQPLGVLADLTESIDFRLRFIRGNWEVARPSRWKPYSKGGTYARWYGLKHWACDWAESGRRYSAFVTDNYPADKYSLLIKHPEADPSLGLTFTSWCNGSIGCRFLLPGEQTSPGGPGIYAHSLPQSMAVAAVCNSRPFSYLARCVSPTNQINAAYVAKIPVPDIELLSQTTELVQLVSQAIAISEHLTALDILDLRFWPSSRHGRSELDWWLTTGPTAVTQLRAVEQAIESQVVSAYGLSTEEASALFSILPLAEETGGAGPETDSTEEAASTSRDEDDCEEDSDTLLAPLPFGSHLARVVGATVYEFRDRILNSRFSQHVTLVTLNALVLQVLGHRWPRQVEAGESVPEWADEDGVIPLTDGAGEPSLVDRVRMRLAAEGEAAAFERDFSELFDKPLDRWLETEFFKHHVKQFKKRPPAWQIQSTKYTAKRKPAFACLIYCQKVNGDTIPKIRTQYVGPLRQRLETEMRGIEAVPVSARSDRQDKRLIELADLVKELRDFDTRLAEVAEGGFAGPALTRIGQSEPLDKWCSSDGDKPHPTDRDAFFRQEAGYNPDVNDGVRVNIAPLQRAGLLAADVLASGDVAKAIDDRAEWRADERRWCREAKLPRPGWWPDAEGATEE